MFYKTKLYFYFISILTSFFIVLFIFLSTFESLNESSIKSKNSLVKTTMLPDLAVSTEAMYIRHRSLSDIFSIFKESPSLTEYFPTTFVYNYSPSINNYPSKLNKADNEAN